MSCFNDVAHFGRTHWNVIQSSGLCSVTPQTPDRNTDKRSSVGAISSSGSLRDGLEISTNWLIGMLIESHKENDHLTSVIRSLPYSLQAPPLLQSDGGGVGITSDGGQVVMSCGDLPDPWISTDHKHAVISLR